MKSAEIRQSFLEFFRERGHTIVPSASLIPIEDPTLLFTNAGMNQFKDVFLGAGRRSYTRAADTQKCIRVTGKHNDLEQVGHDTYHHTFFEMLGNWSFGDYYKREAIGWAWELLTGVWRLPKERLYATVFRDDAEAHALWSDVTDIEPGHILRFGEKDNFWEMGETGPCGPCSELHIDLTADGSGGAWVNAGRPEVIEVWNLVFIQFERRADGALAELPSKHVDTGMGFERITAVLQGRGADNYATDLFEPVTGEIARLAGRGFAGEWLVPMRVIADHLRAVAFAVADGAVPSNEGRGYVLRRLVRRAARYARKLDLAEPFMYRLVPVLAGLMGEVFPEIRRRQAHVEEVLRGEEEAFARTLDRGLDLFRDVAGEVRGRGARRIPGQQVFRLYDTFGFPADLTRLMAEEQGLEIDEAGFDEEMARQRERARAARSGQALDSGLAALQPLVQRGETTLFLGYDRLAAPARVVELLVDGAPSECARAGDSCLVILDQTPFYAESGGQVGDRGVISAAAGALDVTDCRKLGGLIIHQAQVRSGSISAGASVMAEVDGPSRRAAARHHTATHLLQNALRAVVSDRIRQAGSYVGPDRLRFDFNHGTAVSWDQLRVVERQVNERILDDAPLRTYELPLAEVKRREDIIAVFDEKYGDVVRVVEIGDFSRELCGGTHVRSSGEIGYFRLVGEGAIAAGVRRIEALCGLPAVEMAERDRTVLQSLSQRLSVGVEELPQRVALLQEQARGLEKQLEAVHGERAAEQARALDRQVTMVGGMPVLVTDAGAMPAKALRTVLDNVRGAVGDGLALLAAVDGDKVALICAAGPAALARGLHAGQLVREVAERVGGGGGGKPNLAQAGGRDAASLPDALAFARRRVEELLGAPRG